MREHRDFSHPSPPPPTQAQEAERGTLLCLQCLLALPGTFLFLTERALPAAFSSQPPPSIKLASLSRSSFASLSVLLVIGRQGKGEPWGLTCTCTSGTSPLQEVHVFRASIVSSSELCIAESQRDRQTG